MENSDWIDKQIEAYHKEEIQAEIDMLNRIIKKLSRLSKINLLALVHHYWGSAECFLQRKHWEKAGVVEMLAEKIIERGDEARVI